MRQIYLSPHLDDAVLSCAGLMHLQRRAGDSVTVVTLCAGMPDGPLAPLAQRFHAACGNVEHLVAVRRAEDHAVLDTLGASAHHCDTPDAVYRCYGGAPLYADEAALFCAPHPQDSATLPERWLRAVEGVVRDAAEASFYAPLAAGNHVDHQLTRCLAAGLLRNGCRVWFYEDYPHAETPETLEAARAWFGTAAWQSTTVPIDVRAKVAAIRGYRTQVRALFGDDDALEERVSRFTAEVACGCSRAERVRRRLAGSSGRRERLWRRVVGFHAHAERLWSPRP